MKILNLYSGIGGNRRMWQNHEIISVEIDEEIANIYKEVYPQDTVIVTDAHEYLLENFEKFDFIWSSPPCQSHSCIRQLNVEYNKYSNKIKPMYPDMKLYQEIIFSAAK